MDFIHVFKELKLGCPRRQCFVFVVDTWEKYTLRYSILRRSLWPVVILPNDVGLF